MKNNIKVISSTLIFMLTFISFNSKATDNHKPSIPHQCHRLFQETENLITEAEKQPGTHPQLTNIKNKLKQSKQQILAMELETQIKSCEIGLVRLHTKQ